MPMAHGHIYKLYKYAGPDLKCSMMRMFNLMKKKQVYPSIFQPSNIKSFYKEKGDKLDLNNDRGVFNVVKVRSILDKLVYEDIYDQVDSTISCSNIAARRDRNIHNHLFVINGVLNDVQQNKNNSSCVDLGIYDIAKCFDKMWYAETSNDLFKAGVQDDKFILVTNSNKEVAVKTPWGGQLELGHLKCFDMHIGKKDKDLCPVLKVHGADMLTSDREIYLGDILTTYGRIDQNIIERYNNGVGKVNEIMGILQEVSYLKYLTALQLKLFTWKPLLFQ